MADSHMLTTTDNPYNPFTDFDHWNAYDMQVGHHSLALLARVCRTSDELSELDNDQAIELAISEIVEENVSGMHKRVPEPSAVPVP